ncbi:helix-turn-helix domain-containing protein [Paenibacillus sp. KN14-4R]|uniref:helix-turn-helix domain-containing protein n=1 Tax=Paenibacillus sp. KN14-4R TaxID=3445773 RepID=UPI003FA04E7A
MSELGQLLREARIQRKMSLEELQEITKIRKGYLEAIEEGNYRVLPGSFYVKAFIKSYAEAVGIDPQEALNLFRLSSPEPASDEMNEPTIQPRRRGNFRNIEKWGRLASTILVISFIVLILAIIYYYKISSGGGTNDVNQQTKITDKADASTPSPTPNISATPQPTPTPTPTPPKAELIPAEKQGKYDAFNVTNVDKISVTIKIVGNPSWVEVKSADADGKTKTINSSTLQSGETKTWEFDYAALLRIGASREVELSVNGVPVSFSNDDFVKNFRFNLVSAMGTGTTAP